MPAHLGVVLAVDTTLFQDEGESDFPGHDVVEYFDEGIVHEVNAQAENIEVQDADCVRGHNGGLGTNGDDVIQKIVRRQISQLYTFSRRFFWVTNASQAR